MLFGLNFFLQYTYSLGLFSLSSIFSFSLKSSMHSCLNLSKSVIYFQISALKLILSWGSPPPGYLGTHSQGKPLMTVLRNFLGSMTISSSYFNS